VRKISGTFQDSLPNGKPVQMDFEGGQISSDGGAVLLKKVDERLGLTKKLAACLQDKRAPNLIEHSLEDLLRTRILLIGCGYEDCNDADRLRHDPIFKTALGRLPVQGMGLPSQPTLSRFENGMLFEEALSEETLRRMGNVFLEVFLEQVGHKFPSVMTLDFDWTDDPTYGNQQLTLWNGYYEETCYVPLYVYATVDREEHEHLVAALLRSGTSSNHGTLDLLKTIVKRIRETFPGVKICFRGDAGFRMPELYNWCEDSGVDYVIGFGEAHEKLRGRSEDFLAKARQGYAKTKTRIVEYGELWFQAEDWHRVRRVLVKVEISTLGEETLRFLITSRTSKSVKNLYRFYGQRGDSENRIKEMKLDLNSGRTSCSSFAANQFRLLQHAAAFVLYGTIQRKLGRTELGKAQVGTLRMKLLKLGAMVKQSVRRVWIHFSSHFPFRDVFLNLLRRFAASSA
jgi:hypothetical protein